MTTTKPTPAEIGRSNANAAIDQCHEFRSMQDAFDSYEQNASDTIGELYGYDAGAMQEMHEAFHAVVASVVTPAAESTGDNAHAEALAQAAGMSRGAAAQRAYLDYVSQVGLPALTADKVRKLQRVRAVLAELAEAEDCDGETSGALLLARADVGDVLAGCVHLRGTAGDDDDDDDDTAELAAQAYERR